jgi:chromosome segregation ATPase
MATTDVSLLDARQNLQTLETQQAEERKAVALVRVRELREQGNVLERRYRALHSIVVKGDADARRLRSDLETTWRRYESFNAPLPVTAFATDAEIAERLKQSERWKAEHARLLGEINQLEAATGEARSEALAIHNTLPGLRNELQNQATIAAGHQLGEIVDTGLHFVTERFL